MADAEAVVDAETEELVVEGGLIDGLEGAEAEG